MNNIVNSDKWPKSNTEGFVQWFLGIMKIQADQIRADLKTSLLLERVEDVPDYKVRTPLQRGIQLMKRHRDIKFKDQDEKPISIIITTLAARAYEKVIKNPKSLLFYDIIMEMVDAMPSFITRLNGEWEIKNPINNNENFADKWNDNAYKEKDFREWLDKFKFDFRQSFEKGDIQSAIDFLKPNFGTRSINEALKNLKGDGLLLTENSSHELKLSHRQAPLWPVILKYSTKIYCRCKYSGSWNWIDLKNEQIPKDCELLFSATTDVQEPFSVFWQVVNTGKEAEDARDLRGSIFNATTAGRGGLQQKEHSKYAGKHWIECFIVKNGICVSRSNEYFILVS